MKFRTEYQPMKSDLTLCVDKPVLLAGSCFSDNISRRMRESLWNGSNPLGVLYNPLSIAKALRISLIEPDSYSIIDESLFESGGVTNSWLFSSKMSREFRSDAMAFILRKCNESQEILSKGQWLIVTFGTSWCYFLSETPDYVVGNCHRQPASNFIRRRVGVAEIVEVWSELLRQLKTNYPNLQVIFTISPIRHLKDGFEGNSRSKAALVLAVGEIIEKFDFCRYFPVYEIMNDDLRDYRFYESDLAHPNEMAVDYIWDIFKETYLNSEGIETLKEGNSILKAWRHRPMLEGRKSELTEYKESLRRYEISQRWNAFYERHPNAVYYQEV